MLPLELVPPNSLDCLKLDLRQLDAGSIVMQSTFHLIPRIDRTDTGWGTGQDHITRLGEGKVNRGQEEGRRDSTAQSFEPLLQVEKN